MAYGRKPTKEQILERIFPITESGCWIWMGVVSSKYPRFNNHLAHRMSYEVFKGSIPEGLCVCHRCDIPLCVNPDHLFLGTVRDNTYDMIVKGRKWIGVSRRKSDGLPSGSKLTPEKVKSIKRMLAEKISQEKIAKMFGVAQGTISFIKRGETWKET